MFDLFQDHENVSYLLHVKPNVHSKDLSDLY